MKKSTSLLINPKYWNQDKGQVRQLAEFRDKLNLQNSLNDLRAHVLKSFNDSYSKGELIGSDWLESSIRKFFNQEDESDLQYLRDYGRYFISNLPNKIQKNGRTGVSIATIKKYKSTLNKVIEFEKFKRKKYRISEVNLKFHRDFINFMHDKKNLNYNTAGKYLGCTKTFCLDAKKYGIKTHPELERDEFRETREPTYFVTLSESEIDRIFNLQIDTEYLDNARDWLIIGVWTGARAGDLLSLTSDNIRDGFIEYTARKTNQKIVLPIHWQVESILAKREGELPRSTSTQKYNDYIKEVCRLAGLDELCKGAKMNSDSKRKEVGEFPKWQLVSTHIARRSFATNHYGRLPTPVIMSATGHKTEKMLLAYIGKSPQDNAIQLQDYWQRQKEMKSNPTMSVIKNAK
ncbi:MULTISPECIES: tyrosine-type recombinase/integrase [unclassified Robiginitalea]|uniref:tyrosine-type recombinase/integrase n=1 Tax=Robiginitalea TaxID=252306 RepID=UPI00234A8DBA|nr:MULTISPECIES: site-specific integrase [unclassified Robiginitalea]MDC6355556.1 site-specific integrase [Robiginitalea sp. PM2]MDC6375967.1 site-specific integrase [Robiginitalea sp. SP8]